MKLKKLIAILLCCLLSFTALAFTACDEENSKPNNGDDSGWTGIY